MTTYYDENGEYLTLEDVFDGLLIPYQNAYFTRLENAVLEPENINLKRIGNKSEPDDEEAETLKECMLFLSDILGEDEDPFEIKKVIYNGNHTIVLWEDGTKTVVACGEGDKYDPEKGLAMAISKKALGNTSAYYETFKQWIPDEIIGDDDTDESDDEDEDDKKIG